MDVLHSLCVARVATEIQLSWPRDASTAEVAEYPFWDKLVITLIDVDGFAVLRGADAILTVNVTAINWVTNASVCLSDQLLLTGMNLTAGSAQFNSSVCEITNNIVLTFSVVTTAGARISVSTAPFNTTGLLVCLFISYLISHSALLICP